jgi:hypothetical protein
MMDLQDCAQRNGTWYSIRFPDRSTGARGTYLAAQRGPIHCRPGGVYLVSESQVEALRKAGISFDPVRIPELES